MSTQPNQFAWNFGGGQAAADAANAALQNKRNALFTQNMGDRQVGNANDMAQWMQQGNDAVAYQQEQAAAAEQQAQAEAANKAAQIEQIKAQIKELKASIANKKAKLSNWSGVNDKIAAIEARKINAQDPTSIWRWKANLDETRQQRAHDKQAVENEKEKAKAQALQNLKYKIDAQMKPMSVDMATTDNDIKEWSNTLADLEEQGLSGDVGEEYLNKIWKMQSSLKNAKLPSNVASELTNDFDTMMDSYDKIEAHGGYGKNREKYLNDIEANWEKIQSLYTQHGQEVPLTIRKKYIEARNKFNKVKTSKKAGVLSKI